ncbi:hypothetical protein BGW80DRAFT_1252666 [Lactifluus volemus]|nr:hypothetical protein BGW80DRAFT_1252666 [Lactifluus volemus]
MLRAITLERALIFFATLAAITPSEANHDLESRYPHEAAHEESFMTDDSHVVTCARIEESLSTSQVFYKGSPEFSGDMSHWAYSSSQVSACSVRPETPEEVGIILRELALTRTPFAVKSGGHSLNPGFSSTPGVHISLRRMDDIVVYEDSKIVEIGAGLTWIDVYAYLVPKGINVVGARLSTVGVGGYTLGGGDSFLSTGKAHSVGELKNSAGYSWKTNQYGLTVDNIVGYELVLPNGQVKVVTEKDEDLWFALKGIVTKFTFKLYEQTDVWAASLNFEGNLMEDAQKAFATFQTQEHDHKGAQQGKFIYSNGTVYLHRLLYGFISGLFLPTYERGYFDGVPMVRFTEPVIEAYANETKFWGETLSRHDESVIVVYTFDLYEHNFLTHGGQSAYPPDRSRAFLTSNIYVGWSEKSADKPTEHAIRSSHATLVAAGIKDGQDLKDAPPYPNYALFGTGLEEMYGEHVRRLREIRRSSTSKSPHRITFANNILSLRLTQNYDTTPGRTGWTLAATNCPGV